MFSREKNSFLLITIISIFFFISVIAPYAEAISNESVDLLTKTGQAMAEIAGAVKPAVVNVSTSRTVKVNKGVDPLFEDPFFRRFFGDEFGPQKTPKERKTRGIGSGVIVSRDGYILTNNHVIKDADEINVLLPDKREFKGKVIGADPKTDLAVIKIEASNLPTIPWGDSNKLKVGEVVLTIGSPYGLSQTVTMGIVSAVGRANVGIADYEDFIQTDAAINPGNSGGAMVNVRGELVGINTAIFSVTGGYQGIGFAIPSSMAKTVMESLVKRGKVVRGWMGVSVQPITPELAKQFNLKEDFGALVGDITEGGPAEKGGLLRGDVILEYDGKKISEPYLLRNMVADTPPGKEVDIKIIRDGKTKSLKVTIGELPSEMQKTAGREFENAMRGIAVEDLTPEIYRHLNIPSRVKGIIIAGLKEGAPAEEKLMEGDIIQEINRKKITNSKEYENIVSKIKPKEDVLLLIYRKGTSTHIVLSDK
ncbi:MAG: DegQ family serine endoprotease [Nitrospirae bacterium]|nr:DegQ family serine endoprotease [Nitrospirota bacterium]